MKNSTTTQINKALPTLPPWHTLIDTHCHLDMPAYQADWQQVLARARQAGVSRVITVGIDRPSSERAVALAEQHQEIFATVGIHPHHVGEIDAATYPALRQLARHPKVVAYGEIGLDYVKDYAPAALQRQHFADQVGLALELNLPLVIHDRGAHQDCLAILAAAGPFSAGGVMHCFSGDAGFAEQVLALGFLVSIPGVVTFANAEMMREVVAAVPLSALLLETDGPFLAPVPWRGKRNEPAYLLYSAQKVAEIKGVLLEEVARQTTENAIRLFRLDR